MTNDPREEYEYEDMYESYRSDVFPYRWNPDLKRVEFWSGLIWCKAHVRQNKWMIKGFRHPIRRTYWSTWCEPYEGMED